MTGAGVGTVVAVVLAAVWAWAAVAKAVRHAETVEAFASLELPAPHALAIAVPAVELATAAALLARPAVGAAVSLVLLAALTTVVVRALYRGIETGCGCFGSRRSDRVDSADVVRNGVLAALAVLATAAPRLVAPSAVDVVVAALVVVAGGAVLGVAQRRSSAGRARRVRA